MQKNESTENYLERIFMLKQEKGYARATDIASALGFSKASVSTALKRLQESGYVIADENHNLDLTDKGQTIAREMYRRHCRLTDLFIQIGVSEENACSDACKIEHDLSDETYQALIRFFEAHKE